MKQRLFIAALIILWGGIIYGRTLNGEFCSDDVHVIMENPAIYDWTNLGAIWRAFNTRFLPGFTFALNYKLGGLNVFGYHLVNLVGHGVAAYLVYLFVLKTLQTPALKRSRLNDHAPTVACFAALIFLSHPLQTQGVSFIAQRAVVMATCFYLATLLLYVKARLEEKPQYFAWAGVTLFLGLLSKEMTITLPIALFIYEFYFFRRTGDWTKRLTILLLYVPIACLLPALLMQDREGSTLQLYHQIKSQPFSWQYLLTEINVLRTYLKFLILPMGQSHSYDYVIVQKIWEWRTVFSLLVLYLLLAFAFKQFKKRKVISYAIIWFFVATSVEAISVCFIQRGVIYDHWLYLAMVGFAMFVPAALFGLWKDSKLATGVLIILVAVYGLMSYQRNRVWQSCEALWLNVIERSPNDRMPYTNLGVVYSRQGEFDKAIASYTKAVNLKEEVEPIRLAQIYVNMAAVYSRKGEYEQEIIFSKKALELNPYHVQATSNIGLAHILLGNYQQAQAYAHRTVELDPQHASGYNNLGLLYERMERYDQSVTYYRKAVELVPGSQHYRDNLRRAISLRNSGKDITE